jgi:hypothetical protein
VKIFIPLFFDEERIVRVIYSEYNVNPRTKSLKTNFFRFSYNETTLKNELSCIRFELDDLRFIRLFGEVTQDPNYDRNYYGLACTKPIKINQLEEYKLKFTPDINRELKNYFHTDLYDNFTYIEEIGIAAPAEVRYRADILKKIWNVNPDVNESLTHETVLAN